MDDKTLIIPSQLEKEEKKSNPQFIRTIIHLGTLSSAISTFKHRFEDLQIHLDQIQTALNSKSNLIQSQPQPQILIQNPTKPHVLNSERSPNSKQSRSEIENLCESMCSRDLRRYVTINISDTSRLRKEIPSALKLAPNPAKLVSDCIGRFYLQGSKAYSKNSPMIPARQASVLILECFLLIGGCWNNDVSVEQSIRDDVRQGALAWKKRLLTEGGLDKASEVDSRGLLLFVLCFGVPPNFKSGDLGNLLRLCNVKDIFDALKGSRVLIEKMPEIIDSMAKNGQYVEAIELACNFEIEDKFPPQAILTTFLQECKETQQKGHRDTTTPPAELKDLNKKQLSALRSVVKFVEDSGWDLPKLFGGFQIKENITRLENEIADLDKIKLDQNGNSSAKRKNEMIGSTSHENKRSRFHTRDSQPMLASSPNLSWQQRGHNYPSDIQVTAGVNSYLSGVNSYQSGVNPYATRGYLAGEVNGYQDLRATPYNQYGSSAVYSDLYRFVDGVESKPYYGMKSGGPSVGTPFYDPNFKY